MLDMILPPFVWNDLLSVDGIRVRLKIHIGGLDNCRVLPVLPAKIHDYHDRQLDVIAHKGGPFEGQLEAAPSLYQDKERVEYDGCPWTPRIRPALEGKEMFLALRSNCSSKADRS